MAARRPQEIKLRDLCTANACKDQSALEKFRLCLRRQNHQLFKSSGGFYTYFVKAGEPFELRLSTPRAPADWRPHPRDIVTRIVHDDNLDAFKLLHGWDMNIRHFNREGWTILATAFHKPRRIADYIVEKNLFQAADATLPVMVHEGSPNFATFLAHCKEDSFVKLLSLDVARTTAALDAQAIFRVIREYSPTIVDCMVNAGLRVNKRSPENKDTTIHAAVSRKEHVLEVLEPIVEKLDPSLLNATNNQKETALWTAYRLNNPAFEYLLKKGISTDILNGEDLSILHDACWNLRADAVKLLLENGANPNVGAGTEPGTPMHHLVNAMFTLKLPDDKRGLTRELMSILEQHGGDRLVENSKGHTVADLIQARGLQLQDWSDTLEVRKPTR